MHILEKLTPDQANQAQDELVELVQDAVHNGASVGFLSPLTREVAQQYWNDVINDIRQGSRLLLVLRVDGRVLGSVQLDLCKRPNGSHRAEVQKLFVHTSVRRQGFGRALMTAIEQEARNAKRSLLCLDTESHKPAEAMYRRLGWLLVGEIPDYASSPDGHLRGTTIFYKKIPALR
jgi:ribosomal protein S18 acetylase RimI-like enzyme